MSDEEKKSRTFEYRNVYAAAVTLENGEKLQPGETVRMKSDDVEKYNGMLKRV